ncbi:MAG TPA: DUF167 family protein [Steroidobacteraceae bacterium]|nr:DUF167 family protein [Steroidobacteraceae bacterium]
MTSVAIRRDGNDLLLEVRVQPRASRTEFAGLMGERLRVRLNAPPVDGRANAALVEFVADACNLPRARVTLDKGTTGRDKRLRLHGLAAIPPALQRALAPA